MGAAVDYDAGNADAGRIDARVGAEEIGACGFEARELSSRVEAIANRFEYRARAAKKSEMGFCTTDVAGQN